MSPVELHIDDLSPEQRELLALLLEREGHGPPPLSSTQRRLFSTSQLAPRTCLGNVPFAFQISGPLDVPALNRSLNEIVRRHEVLRTTFRELDRRPTGVVAPSVDISLSVVDLQALAASERNAEALRRVDAEARRPFDVGQGPLLRGQVIHLADEEWVLVLVTHHLVTDGWGVRLLLQELGALYRSSLTGTAARLPELSVQYAGYARWERQWLQSDGMKPQLEYWRARLAGAPALELPLDRLERPASSWTTATQRFELPPQLSDALRGLSRKEGVTLYTVLLAGFQTLLQRYSLQTDVVVGTTISRRHRSEWEALIGNFGNNLLLRTDFSDDPTFRILLHRVYDVVVDAFAYPDVPLEMLMATAPPEGPTSRLPPFQVMFIMRDTTLARNLDLERATVSSIPVAAGASALDLTLDLTGGDPALTGYLEYKTQLFAATSVARILREYRDLLDRIAGDPDERISQFRVLRRTSGPARGSDQAVGCSAPGFPAEAACAPRTPTERLIASLWQQALAVRAVGVHDNFFDLGGHSLLGTAVIDRIERETGCRLTLVDLGLQNLGQLAQRCDQRSRPGHLAGMTGRLLRLVRGTRGRE